MEIQTSAVSLRGRPCPDSGVCCCAAAGTTTLWCARQHSSASSDGAALRHGRSVRWLLPCNIFGRTHVGAGALVNSVSEQRRIRLKRIA